VSGQHLASHARDNYTPVPVSEMMMMMSFSRHKNLSAKFTFYILLSEFKSTIIFLQYVEKSGKLLLLMRERERERKWVKRTKIKQN